jgi:hypothetical protein
MSEYCPKCSAPLAAPLAAATDEDRLCDKCGWFGDSGEVQYVQVEGPTATFVKCLDSYREVCRCELIAEQWVSCIGTSTEGLKNVILERRNIENELVGLFDAIRKSKDT